MDQENNALEMSDEDFLNTSWGDEEISDIVPAEDGTIEPEAPEAPVDDQTEQTDEVTVEEENNIEDATDDSEREPSEEPEDEEVTEGDDAESEEEESESEDETEAESDEIDYKAQYEKILAPFKANGREMKVDSVDDAIRLMQMGANYNKKMSALKPNLKLMKMLENNGLLQEDKLSFLIDLDKKDPNAVKKLVKESKIDTLDLDDENVEYQPKSYTVDDRELELDAVLENIKDTDTYSQTIDVISNKWDETSRRTIIENPKIIEVINEHQQNGVYAQIQTEIERERMLGRLSGLSDIEAYRQVGDRLYQEGRFNNPEPTPKPSPDPTPKAKSSSPKQKQRKRAAAPTKASPSASSNDTSQFNPLNLSDEEFEKQFSEKFL